MSVHTAGRAHSGENANVIPLYCETGVPLPLLRPGDDVLHETAERMWPAWRSLTTWEDRAAGEFGQLLGQLVLLLWGVHRFSGVDEPLVIYEELTDAGTYDPLLADIAEMAFALGASWGADPGREHGFIGLQGTPDPQRHVR